jgi:CubicO group peptidase (beta-lactamase class C family)
MVVRKPAAIGFEQAAAVPTSGVTALQAVRDWGRVRPGQTVLVSCWPSWWRGGAASTGVAAQEGLLALDDPVQRYLPAGVELPVRGRPITLADLATHTAGLPRLPHGFVLRSVRHRRNPYAWLTVDDLYAGLPSTRLRREPGGRPRYSNLGYGLLGHVLAVRARAAVMSSSSGSGSAARWSSRTPVSRCPRPRADSSRRATTGAADRVPHWDLPVLAGAGALRSTVADLLAFLLLHLGEGEPALARSGADARAPIAPAAVGWRWGSAGRGCRSWAPSTSCCFTQRWDGRLPKLRRVRAGHPHRGGGAVELGALGGRARLPNPRTDRRLASDFPSESPVGLIRIGRSASG